MSINYKYISQAIDAYINLGYEYIEVPWLVNSESTYCTLPKGKVPFLVDIPREPKFLIGSAEQSFVYMALKNKLSSGKYVAASPCFRDDAVDELHQKHFFKVELIDLAINKEPGSYYRILSDARNVLSNFTKRSIVIQTNDDGCDLLLSGIEIGSYGSRSFKNLNWSYGTGIAEPRFSIADGML